MGKGGREGVGGWVGGREGVGGWVGEREREEGWSGWVGEGMGKWGRGWKTGQV